MRPFIILFATLLLLSQAIGQTSNAISNVENRYKKHLIKLNVTAPILKNYSVQYEHIISKRISFAISGRMMPASTIPFRNTVVKKVLRDENITDRDLITQITDKVKFSNFAFTPEARIYTSRKGYGQGFYIAPYYRYATYTMHHSNISIEENGETIPYVVDLSGKLTSHTGGLLLGMQWHLTKIISVDIWLMGPNIGSGKGNIVGYANQTLDAESQQELKRQLENIDIPFTKETINVNANGGTMDLKGPWGGIRSGIVLGIQL